MKSMLRVLLLIYVFFSIDLRQVFVDFVNLRLCTIDGRAIKSNEDKNRRKINEN